MNSRKYRNYKGPFLLHGQVVAAPLPPFFPSMVSQSCSLKPRTQRSHTGEDAWISQEKFILAATASASALSDPLS